MEEYYQWMEFYAEEPFPSERIDLVGAQISSMIYNMNRGKNSPARDVSDFMIIARTQRAKVEAEDENARSERQLKVFIASMGGTIQ
jgi:hypothetical protein